MKILLDMNLSPSWVLPLKQAGHEPVHWTDVGAMNASDREIMTWARSHNHVVITHDLDFGAILAATGAERPSVILLRSQNVTFESMGAALLSALDAYAAELSSGILMSIDETGSRIRLLPLP